MLSRNTLGLAGTLLVASALTAGLGSCPRLLRARPVGGRESEAVAELKKRLARLEAEVAELRKALVRAGGGTPDSASQKQYAREVATLRAADLLQRTHNTHAVLREVMGAKVAGQTLLTRINDLNNDLSALWIKMASYGVGTDPYLDLIQLSRSGFSRAKPPPNHGIPEPYPSLGLPRLHERFLEASGLRGKAAEKQKSAFRQLVRAYSNPGVYPHHDFSERAYSDYREGKGLFTAQYTADLRALDEWLTGLEGVLGKVPGHFEAAP